MMTSLLVSKKAFTLLEVILSITILSTLSLLSTQVISRALKARTKIQAEVDDVSALRDSMRMIRTDINMAFHHRDFERTPLSTPTLCRSNARWSFLRCRVKRIASGDSVKDDAAISGRATDWPQLVERPTQSHRAVTRDCAVGRTQSSNAAVSRRRDDRAGSFRADTDRNERRRRRCAWPRARS